MTEIEAQDLFGEVQNFTNQDIQKQEDMVNHPSHYTQSQIECIDGIEAAISGLHGAEAFLTGCIIKYLWRWKRKGGKQDLEKARWYIDRLIGQQDA